MSTGVRRATAGDVPALAALRRAWTEENVGDPVQDPGFEDLFATWFEREAHQRITWVAEDAGRVVGMLNMLVFTRMPRPRSAATARPQQWGYVANVFVLPGSRERGLGARLLEALTEHADAEGYARLVLSPTERSVPFYGRAGFAPATSLLLRPGPA